MKALFSILYKIENFGFRYFYQKAPGIPEGPRRLIAKFIPWCLILFIIWQLYGLVQYISFELVTPSISYLYVFGSGGFGIFGIMLVGMSVVMELVALPGLMRYKRIGWQYFFYGQVLAIFNEMIHFNLINLIFGGLISLYLLFQIRGYYN